MGPRSHNVALETHVWRGECSALCNPNLVRLSFLLSTAYLSFCIDKKGNTLRHVGRNVPGDKHKTIHCTSHLGVVSAIHLSSVAGKQIKTKIKTFHFYLHIMDWSVFWLLLLPFFPSCFDRASWGMDESFQCYRVLNEEYFEE